MPLPPFRKYAKNSQPRVRLPIQCTQPPLLSVINREMRRPPPGKECHQRRVATAAWSIPSAAKISQPQYAAAAGGCTVGCRKLRGNVVTVKRNEIQVRFVLLVRCALFSRASRRPRRRHAGNISGHDGHAVARTCHRQGVGGHANRQSGRLPAGEGCRAAALPRQPATALYAPR